jgi:hypothetical protein
MQEIETGAPAPEGVLESDDSVVDQIGALLQKLPKEKQIEIIAQLSEMLGAGGEPEAATVTPEGGVNGKPASMSGY